MKLDHVTINVKDMEKSEWFYGEVLGLKKLDNVDMGDHELHYFSLGSDGLLELIQYHEDTGEAHLPVKTRGIMRHLAFSTEDVDSLYRKLCDAGITVTSKPDNVKKLNFRNILVQDPNGVELEFVQRF